MLNVFQKVIDRLKNECLESGYETLLEADVSGWLFHLFLMQSEVEPRELHLDTRVLNADGRFDIAVGPLTTGANGRPCVEARMVAEVKLFPRIGFTDQQHRVHYEHILNDDLRKLGGLDPAVGLRVALIVDGRGYLGGTYQGYNRRDYLINRRNNIAPRVHICIIHAVGEDWQIEYETPKPTPD